MSTFLRSSKSPNLLVGPVEYSQRYQDQLNNLLRLYFNEVDNVNSSLLNNGGGRFLSFPHIAASDSTDQYATASNTPTIVKWNTLDAGYGFTLAAPGTATAEFDGIYKITYSLQFVNTANGIHDVVVWLKVGGNDVVNSSTQFTLPARKSAGVPSYLCGYSEVVFSINAGQTIQLYWATDLAYVVSPATDGVYMFHDPAQTVPYARPAIPSALGSITFLSRQNT